MSFEPGLATPRVRLAPSVAVGFAVAACFIARTAFTIDGEWYFEEFTPDTGIRSLGLPEVPASPTEEEQRSILDLFRN